MIAMENMDGARRALVAAMERHGVDCAQLSRLIGRNPAYIQQYLQRGSPRQLAERDRALIAEFLGVTEGALGAPTRAAVPYDAPVAVPRLDIAASAGGGGFAGGEAPVAHFGFDRDWLRQLGVRAGALSLLRVRGDSMAPTLDDGDDILIDGDDAGERLRDGIYVLRRDGSLLVKRLARRGGGMVAILSDNPAYPDEGGVALNDLALIGRVVWTGRKLR